MRKLITLLALFALASPAIAQTTFIGNYANATAAGTDRFPVVQGCSAQCASGGTVANDTLTGIGQYIAAQISGACTMNSSFVITCSAVTGLSGTPTSGEFWGYNGTSQGWMTPTASSVGWANVTPGTNSSTGNFACTGNCLITGNVNASEINAVNPPTTCTGVAGWSSAGAPECINPTSTGCIAVSNGQIYTSCMVDPQSTFANLPACSSSAVGTQYVQTDAAWAPTRGSAAAGGGTSTWKVQCLDDAGTYGWYYL